MIDSQTISHTVMPSILSDVKMIQPFLQGLLFHQLPLGNVHRTIGMVKKGYHKKNKKTFCINL